MAERIVIFDIEMLNNDPASVCSIGIVEMIDFQIVSTFYSLIKPAFLKFDPIRYNIHHINPDKLRSEKTFKEIWKEINHYFKDSIIVSHDIIVDMMHLRAALKNEDIAYPNIKMSCTNVLAHLLHPELKKYNLTELTKIYDFTYDAHHALEDAKACAYILKCMVQNEGFDTLTQLHMHYHLAFGEMKHNYYRNIVSPETIAHFKSLPEIQINDLYHKSVCFTGKLSVPKDIIIEKTKQVSALPTNQVSTQTSLLVVGKEGYYKVRFGRKNKKVLKALDLIKNGQDLKIIHENEYIKLLNER